MLDGELLDRGRHARQRTRLRARGEGRGADAEHGQGRGPGDEVTAAGQAAARGRGAPRGTGVTWPRGGGRAALAGQAADRPGGSGPPGSPMAWRRSSRPSAGSASPMARRRRLSARSASASARHSSQAARCMRARSRSSWPSSPSTSAVRRSPRWVISPPRRLGRTRRGAASRAAVFERGAQLCAAAVDAAAHGAELHADRRGDLLIGQALDVAQHDDRAIVGCQPVECRLHVGVELFVVIGLRRASARCRAGARPRRRTGPRTGCAGAGAPGRGTGWW